jgi:hypothetical protein
VDVANNTQWPEYNRILEMLGKMGVERILYAGVNSDVSNRSASECSLFALLLYRYLLTQPHTHAHTHACTSIYYNPQVPMIGIGR